MSEECRKALCERRGSSSQCSVADRGCEGIIDQQSQSSNRTCRQRPALKGRKSRAQLPFSSVLISHLSGNQQSLQALELTTPLQFDWVQQALGTANNVKHILAGALSAVFSKTATAPLERIKMEMQLKQRGGTLTVAKKLLADGGYLNFWKGNGMNLLRVTPHKAVNFYSFYLYRTILKKGVGSHDSFGISRFIAGALAGSTATLTCFPLDVIRTRMLSRDGERYRTAIGTLKAILKEETYVSLYVGCLPAIVSTAASGAIFYGVYDLLKERYLRSREKQGFERDLVLSAGRTMLYGAIAGAAAESVLYPLEVLRRRMQLQNMQATEVMLGAQQVERMMLAAATERGVFSQSGAKSVPKVHQVAASAMKKQYLRRLINAAVEIYKMDGIPGFYQGFTPHMCQVLPSAALSYYFYESCKLALGVKE